MEEQSYSHWLKLNVTLGSSDAASLTHIYR